MEFMLELYEDQTIAHYGDQLMNCKITTHNCRIF